MGGIGHVPRHGSEAMFQLQYPIWHLKTKELGGEATELANNLGFQFT